MDLSSMPVDSKQQQTMMWQQNQYMSDSGIHSGQPSQACKLHTAHLNIKELLLLITHLIHVISDYAYKVLTIFNNPDEK